MHHHCLRCGHDWVARTDRPRACPQCKTYRWDQPIGQPTPKTLVEVFTEEDAEEAKLSIAGVAIPAVEILGHEPDPDRPLGDQIGQALNEMPKAEKLALLKRVAKGEQVPELELPIGEPDVSALDDFPPELEIEPDLDAPTSLDDLPSNAPETPKIVLATPPDPHFGELDVVTEGLDQTRGW